MDGTKLTREIFLKEVESHELEIIKDEGPYRHLRLAKPRTSNQRFDIITWPGYLAYVGDMGDFVFTRFEDMFDFFRSKKLEINPGYWAEKVVAQSVYGNGVKEFSVEDFHESVLSFVRDVLEVEADDSPLSEDIMDELRPLLHAEDEWECVAAIRDFSSDNIDFTDFWEHSCMHPTWHYIWCCYAIVWAIGRYDELIERRTHELSQQHSS